MSQTTKIKQIYTNKKFEAKGRNKIEVFSLSLSWWLKYIFKNG